MLFGDLAREAIGAAAARVGLFCLAAMLTANVVGEFIRTGHVTGLLLVTSEAIVVVLAIIRRPARTVDKSPGTVIVTMLSIAGPFFLRATSGPALAPDIVTAIVSALGLGFEVAAKMVLGRSFGLIPANRGVVSNGPYCLMRHPIYAGYLVAHAGFLAAHPSVSNLAILILADTALVIRALREERVLARDSAYQVYCHRVAWHLVPGVF